MRWARALRGLPLSNVAVDGAGATAVVTVDARYDETKLLVDAGALHVFDLSRTGDQRFEVLAPGDHPLAQSDAPRIAFDAEWGPNVCEGLVAAPAGGPLIIDGSFEDRIELGGTALDGSADGAIFVASLPP